MPRSVRVPFAVEWPAAFAILVWLLTSSGALEAQSQPGGGRGFLQLQGAGCGVGYSPGSLDRAHHLLRRLELLTGFFNRWSETPVPAAAYVLTREDWEGQGISALYGLPARLGPTTILMPSQGDAGTVELWQKLLASDRLPLVPGVPLQGTAEEAASLALADVFMQIEAARAFVQRQELLGVQARDAWIGEVAAHVAALTVFQRLEPTKVPELESLFSRLEALGSATSVESFQPRTSVATLAEAREWLAFQGRFFRAANGIVRREGKNAVKKLQAAKRKAGGQLRRDVLLKRHPWLEDWLAE